MKSPKNCINILLVGLDDKFCKSVSQELAETLQMHFTDCGDIVNYYIQEKDLILQKVGLDYLKRKEKSALKECANFRDCVLTINFDYFKHNLTLFKNSAICYLRIDDDKKLNVIDRISFNSRDEFLKENSHIIVDLKKNDKHKAVKTLIKNLGEIL